MAASPPACAELDCSQPSPPPLPQLPRLEDVAPGLSPAYGYSRAGRRGIVGLGARAPAERSGLAPSPWILSPTFQSHFGKLSPQVRGKPRGWTPTMLRFANLATRWCAQPRNPACACSTFGEANPTLQKELPPLPRRSFERSCQALIRAATAAIAMAVAPPSLP